MTPEQLKKVKDYLKDDYVDMFMEGLKGEQFITRKSKHSPELNYSIYELHNNTVVHLAETDPCELGRYLAQVGHDYCKDVAIKRSEDIERFFAA